MAFSLGNSANSIPPQSDPVRNVQPLRGRSRCCRLILMPYANLCNAARPAKQPCAVSNLTGTRPSARLGPPSLFRRHRPSSRRPAARQNPPPLNSALRRHSGANQTPPKIRPKIRRHTPLTAGTSVRYHQTRMRQPARRTGEQYCPNRHPPQAHDADARPKPRRTPATAHPPDPIRSSLSASRHHRGKPFGLTKRAPGTRSNPCRNPIFSWSCFVAVCIFRPV